MGSIKLTGWADLIALNPTPLSQERASSRLDIEQFAKILETRGVNVTIRNTRGQAIDAACGRLRVMSGNRSAPG